MRQALLLAVIATAAGQPVKLLPYPQKIVTFHDSPVVEARAREARAADGAVWTATAKGVWRRDSKAAPRDRVQYFAGRRYLPDGEILGLAPDRSGGMWVRTSKGASHIEFRPMTLAAKAAGFEERIEARHVRHGFTADSELVKAGNLASSVMRSTDNDGLWTAIYVSAELLRYRVTGSAEALAKSRRGLEGLLFLEQVTGRPGFPARSYIETSEQRPGDGTWYRTAEGLQWKADTSSDEIVGHMLAFALASDHLPAGDPLRPRIAATTRRIMDHILANGYHLVDVTGKPTTWGKWSKEYFATEGGKPDSPLNATELLSFLLTAHHVTGDRKYLDEYRKVAFELGYAEITTRYLELSDELNYSDEELAMLSFYPLFLYERDAKMLDIYRRAASGWWKNESRELNPLWTFIYALARPRTQPDLEGAVWTLYRFPMDLVTWTVDNSARGDLPRAPAPGRHGETETTKLIPPDERPVMKWNSSPFRLSGGNGGRSEDDGAAFLLPYWLGRHHGLIQGE